jgi:alpha-L-fucosidase
MKTVLNRKKRTALCALVLLSLSASAFGAADGITDGVHGYTPKGYVQPTEPEVRRHLEWFKDQKIALMMHFGLYSNLGLIESWALSDSDGAKWSRREVTWTKDGETFKRQYYGLNRSFNPVRFQPEEWARVAKDAGFRYLLFTTKHHDGFCLFDSKYTDFKTTAPECPFSTHPRADIVKHVFNAFRAEGLGIAAYFSKPDWHHDDYWEGYGLGRKTTRMPTYDVRKHPEKWARFKAYTRNQILELIQNYGKIDVIWLDGGQVQRRCGLDIDIEKIIADARKIQPWLISADRVAGGSCENVITPEQTIPKRPIAVPWESCITIGKSWGYHFDDEYKSAETLISLLIDIVAKGGNLALNVGPQPDGRLPHQALERLARIGKWLKANGEAIYATRPLPPFREGVWAFTRARVTGAKYAIRLWKGAAQTGGRQTLPAGVSAAKVVHVASGRTFACASDGKLTSFELPKDFVADAAADVFRLVD